MTIDDSDTTTRNTADIRLRENDIVYEDAKLTDNSLKLGFYTLPTYKANIATKMPIRYPQFSNLPGYYDWNNSVYYSPTIFFGVNVDITADFFAKFQQFTIDRPTAPQSVTTTLRSHRSLATA